MLKISFTISLIGGLLLLCACVNDSPDNIKTATTSKIDSLPEIKHPQLDLINEQIAIDSTNAELYFSRGIANQKLMNYQSAAIDFEKAITLNDTVASYYLNLAGLFAEGKNIVPAINVLSKGLEKQPGDVNMLLELSQYYIYINDTGKSIKMANEVLKSDASNVEAYFAKGMALAFSGDTLKAISTFQTATEQNPDYYNAFVQLGLLCAGKKMKLAEGYYKNAIRIEPKSKEAWYGLAMYHQNTNNFAEAKATYREIIGIDAQYKDAYYNIGYIYFNEDSLKKALKHFNMAANVDVGFTRAYYMRGLVYESMGDMGNAKKDYNRTLSLDADFEMAKKGLSRLKVK